MLKCIFIKYILFVELCYKMNIHHAYLGLFDHARPLVKFELRIPFRIEHISSFEFREERACPNTIHFLVGLSLFAGKLT